MRALRVRTRSGSDVGGTERVEQRRDLHAQCSELLTHIVVQLPRDVPVAGFLEAKQASRQGLQFLLVFRIVASLCLRAVMSETKLTPSMPAFVLK